MVGWAAGQRDSMGHFVDGFEEKRRLRLRCCCYVQPGASGVPGGLVLVGRGATLDVLASGVALVVFLLVPAGDAVVTIPNTPSVGPAVACGVGALLVVGAPTTPTTTAAASISGRKLDLEGFDLVGKVSVGGGKGGVCGNQLRDDTFVVGSGADKIVKGVVNGVEETVGLVGLGWVGTA